MTGPFAEDSIVMGFETGRPERYLRFEPDGLDGNRWLHRADQFDEDLDRETVVERYALPEAETYRVSVVEVPEGETLRMGSVAAMHGREGGRRSGDAGGPRDRARRLGGRGDDAGGVARVKRQRV